MSSALRILERRFNLGRYLSKYETKPSGNNLVMRCPSCDKPDKLWVLAEKKTDATGERTPGSFICYYCRDTDGDGVGNGPLQLIQWLEDVDFLQALDILAANGDDPASQDLADVVSAAFKVEEHKDLKEEPVPSVELPEGFRRITEKRRPRYLRERGISVKRAVRYKMGYCEHGYHANRLVVPVYLDGRLVSWQARYMRKDPPPGVKKTLFPKGAKSGQVLFNFDQAKHCQRIIVVEDPWSAVHLGRTAVATFGTTVTSHQLALLLRTEADEVVMMWDQDAIEKAYKAAVTLSSFFRVRVVELPDARDPDERSVDELRDLIRQAPEADSMSALAGVVRLRLAGIA